MKKIKFSKSYNNIFNIKSDFYQENKTNLKNVLRINSIYSKQIKRKNCKNCNTKLKSPIFTSFKVKYTVCEKCKHLNGMNNDVKKFVEFLYQHNKGQNYSKNYLNHFNTRVKNIYLPNTLPILQII